MRTPLTITRIVDGPVPADECTPLRVACTAHGALASFLGVVRDEHHGKAVTHIVYDCHRAMAATVLTRLAAEVRSLHAADSRIHIVHAVGTIGLGEPAVAIHVSSAHRVAAFAGCRHLIERIKEDLPVWKHECYADGTSAWLQGS